MNPWTNQKIATVAERLCRWMQRIQSDVSAPGGPVTDLRRNHGIELHADPQRLRDLPPEEVAPALGWMMDWVRCVASESLGRSETEWALRDRFGIELSLADEVDAKG